MQIWNRPANIQASGANAMALAAILLGLFTSVFAQSGTYSNIIQYPVQPSANIELYGIATGADGALWFTEVNANKVGRITTAGVITEYPIPSNPERITAGPDGALWFSGSQIGRITTSGEITQYPIGGGEITVGRTARCGLPKVTRSVALPRLVR